MRIRIAHRTSYRYDTPATGIIQMLRLTPRNHDSQFVVDWRIGVSADCRLDQHEDAFGNISHTFSADGPFTEFSVAVEGEVETRDTGGVVTGTIERFPPSLFLRETPLTTPDDAIISFAAQVRAASSGDQLNQLHALLTRLHGDMTFDPDPTHAATKASEAFSLKRGVCQDLTHIFIAAARTIGIPARYISGHLYREDDTVDQHAGHAWAEAFVPNLGWVAFDATNGICASDAYVRVAAGLDYLGAAPVRGTRYGGTGETLSVSIRVDQASRQSQN
jgi:transglutaminase-like putative cysteine protease